MRHRFKPPRRTPPAALCLATATLVFAAWAAQAQDVVRTPLPKGHPLVGVWRIDVPDTDCHEIYDIRPNGTMRVTSGRQAAESEFTISLEPSADGFYTWVDKIIKDNGGPDCTGSVSEVGHVAVNYILLTRGGRQFLMCEEEDEDTCVGPFVRQESI